MAENSRSDLAVVGGGPIGLATAIYARNRGLEVDVFDKKSPTIDKACGEGLMPAGVRELTEGLDVSPDKSRSTRFHGIRYLDDGLVSEGRFREGHGLGIRRTALHEALTVRALELGARLHWDTNVNELKDARLLTETGQHRADWIVGADGLHSDVRSWAGLETTNNRAKRVGLVQHFYCDPWTDLVEVYWQDDFEVYVTPVGDNEIGIAVLSEKPPPSFERATQSVPALHARLDEATPSSRTRGWGPLYQTVSGVHAGRVFLVGDAAGYRDAITGEGLSVGFKQARALVEAVCRNDPAYYVKRHAAINGLPNTFIEILLWLRQYPRLRKTLMKIMGEQSRLFSFLITANDRGFFETLRSYLPKPIGQYLSTETPGIPS